MPMKFPEVLDLISSPSGFTSDKFGTDFICCKTGNYYVYGCVYYTITIDYSRSQFSIVFPVKVDDMEGFPQFHKNSFAEFKSVLLPIYEDTKCLFGEDCPHQH